MGKGEKDSRNGVEESSAGDSTVDYSNLEVIKGWAPRVSSCVARDVKLKYADAYAWFLMARMHHPQPPRNPNSFLLSPPSVFVM